MSKYIENYNKRISVCIREVNKKLSRHLAFSKDLQDHAEIQHLKGQLEKLNGMLDFKQSLAKIESLKKTLIEENEIRTGEPTTDEQFCFLEALAVYMIINPCSNEKDARFFLWLGGEEEGRKLREKVGLLYVDAVI